MMRTISIFIVSLLIGSSCIIALEMEMEMEMEEEFYPDERDALIQLRDMVESPSSKLHANWTGRACNSKNESRWAGVGCSDWHVTHLVLEGIQLTNSLPFPPLLFHNLTYLTKLSFANNSLHGPLPNLTINLVQLQYVVLSNNQFSGSIPLTYIDLPNLTKLELQENDLSGEIPPFDQQPLMAFNVSHNKLRGPIPETGVLRRFPESSYANNSGLCGGDIPGLSPCPPPPPPPPPPFQPSGKNDGSRRSIALIAAAVVLAIVPLCVIFTCYMRVWRKAKKRKQEVTDDPERTNMEMEMEFLGDRGLIFSVDDLLRSAAEVIGRGNLGSTYKAVLECGSVVAVKRIILVEEHEKKHQVKKEKEFAQQMQLLGNMMKKHQNLAEMIAFYNSKQEKLIVYEYVADGSLFSLLHENRGIGGVVLDWKSRVGIIIEIAKGLEHLHEHGHLHGNLKSSNVLIQRSGGSFRVKLTDYGLLAVAPPHKLSVGRTPEFLEEKKKKKLTMTSKARADVYCFGIVVLEMVTGRAPNSNSEELSGWVREAVSVDWSTDIVDIQILGEKEGYEDMLSLTEIALHCTDHLPHRRPTITQLLTTLQHISHHTSSPSH